MAQPLPAFRHRPAAAADAAQGLVDEQQQSCVIGIDLGTSFSAVAALKDGKPYVLEEPGSGRRTVPSVVTFTKEDSTVVGWEALGYNAAPTDRIYSFKRLMGQSLDAVAGDAARLLYTVVEGDRGEALVYSAAADGVVSPEELSAELLRHLRATAERALRRRVTGAVVAVPAHFDARQQRATLAAAALAGLPHTLLLQEPVAAALAHGIRGGTDGETVLVFDLGGGTFDASILQAFEGIMEVLGTAGDSYLGGDDLDAAIARWLLDQLPTSAGASAAGGSSSSSSGSAGSAGGHPHWEWALRAAEQAKVQLSAAPSATIELPEGAGAVELTQQRFEALTVELFQRMADVLEELGRYCHVQWAVPPGAAAPGGEAAAARHEEQAQAQQQQQQQQQQQGRHHSEGTGADRWAPPPRRVTRAVLVGQCSRLPSVRAFVARLCGVAPDAAVDPAEAVALGAAAHAGMLLGGVGGLELMDGAYSAELHGRASGWSP